MLRTIFASVTLPSTAIVSPDISCMVSETPMVPPNGRMLPSAKSEILGPNWTIETRSSLTHSSQYGTSGPSTPCRFRLDSVWHQRCPAVCGTTTFPFVSTERFSNQGPPPLALRRNVQERPIRLTRQ